MSHKVLVQPNGLLAVWSTVVDSIVVWDCTDEELVEYWASEAAMRERSRAQQAIAEARSGRTRPSWPPTWDVALAEHQKLHGPLVEDEPRTVDGP